MVLFCGMKAWQDVHVEVTVGMNLTDVPNRFVQIVGNRYCRLPTISFGTYYIHKLKWKFANKRQLNTFVIYECACNLLFCTNDKVLFRTQTSILTLKMCNCQQETRLTRHTSLIFCALASHAHFLSNFLLLKLKINCWERNIVHFQPYKYVFYSHSLCCLCIFTDMNYAQRYDKCVVLFRSRNLLI